MAVGRIQSPGRSVHVRSGADALAVVSRLAATPARPETIALLLDDGRLCRTSLVVEGTREPDDVLSVARLLAEASEREPSIHAVVLASVRTDHVDAAPIIRREHEGCLRDDVDRWLELLDVFGGVGVDLLDWFVLGHGEAASLRALTGLAARRSSGREGSR